jgi:hypothetical protein
VGYDLKFAAEAIWKVAAASLILGAGLPVLFAARIKSHFRRLGAGDGRALRAMIRERAFQSATPDDPLRVSAVLARGGWPLVSELNRETAE